MTTTDTPQTMTIVTQSSFGGPEVLRIDQAPRPVPLPTEVLVRVEAAGINPVDWKSRAGHGMAGVLGEPPFVLGWDVAGVVEEIGFGVTTLAPGDRVFGMPWFPRAAGGYGQFVTAPARHFVTIPDNLTMEQAAGVPLAALTAWQVLVDTADVRAGQTVVVTAAAGGVGHFVVQLAQQLGATVIAVASERHHDWLLAHGASQAIDYTQVDFSTQVSSADVVVELVGSDESATRGVAALRPGGLIVAVPGGVSPAVAAAAEQAGVRTSWFLVAPDRLGMTRIAELLASGTVVVEIAEVFDLADVAKAHELSESGRTHGKLVLRVDHADIMSTPVTTEG